MSIDSTYHKLRTMIYRGQLNSGQRIVERRLAEELGVSRVPLRESMVRLESEGLIRSVPHSSNYVATLGPRELLEIYSMRLWLEPPATRLATLKKSHRLLRSLTELCDRMTAAVESEEHARVDEYDYRFHYAIVEACGNARLIRAYDASHIRIVGLYTDFLTIKTLEPNRLTRQHQQIIRAIERGDPDQSEKVARVHVQRSITNFEKKFGIRLES